MKKKEKIKFFKQNFFNYHNIDSQILIKFFFEQVERSGKAKNENSAKKRFKILAVQSV